jgi:hypothetical protein
MKTLKYSFGLLAMAVIFLSSCRDFVEPNVPYKDFDTGAYLRTIARTSTTLNFFDLANSKFALTIEAVDKEDGKTVQTVEVRVRHRRLIPGVGLKYTPANDVLVKTLQASDFKTNTASRFLRADISITAAEAIAAVGLTNAGIQGGDVFEFRLVLNDKFGRRFSSDNVTTNVAGAPFYDSPFQYPVSVVCPSDLAGTFAYSTLVTSSPYKRSCEGQVLTGNVNFTRFSPTAYTVSDQTFGLFTQCSGDGPGGVVRINDACGALSFSGSDQYGSTYKFTFKSNNGTKLVFDWISSDNEGGTTTLTAASGKPWPATLK